MLVVKNISNNTEGNGITIITISIKMARGKPKGLIFS